MSDKASAREVRARLRNSLTTTPVTPAASPARSRRASEGRVNTDLDPGLRRWFKRAAEDAGTTMMQVLAEFVAALRTDPKLAGRFLRPPSHQ